MAFAYSYLLPAMWLGFMAYWVAMSRNVKEVELREPALSRFVRLAAIVCAVALLWLPSVPVPVLRDRVLAQGILCFWVGAAVTAVGLSFGAWARHHLGSNWSQSVTVMEGHELVTSGPYSIVRHPIYTGLLLGFLGCAVARNEWRGVLALALVFGVLWPKLTLEEQWMRARFGAPYEAYAGRVAALLPGVL